MTSLLDRIDHLVYATTDLESSVTDLEQRLGVRASPGGSHPGRGTRNALIALGARCYLEIIAPDPGQPASSHSRWFGIEARVAPRLVAWAANATSLDALAAEAAQQGFPLGAISSGSRARSDGVTLTWRFSDPTAAVDDGVMPFFIDWGTSPHPATSAASGATLLSLRAEHPDPGHTRERLRAVGIPLEVTIGPGAALFATIQSRHGVVVLS